MTYKNTVVLNEKTKDTNSMINAYICIDMKGYIKFVNNL